MDPQALALLVVCGGLAIGLVFGAVAQRTHFCTMGAIADLVNFGDATRLRLWVWAVLVALLGTQALIGLAGLDLSASLYTAPRLNWLSQAFGGLLFGFGMVLASGCPSRALVRTGGGNLKALVVLIVVGLAAQMTLRGVFALPRVEGLDAVALRLAGAQDLPSWLARASGLAAAPLRLALCVLLAASLLAWLLRSPDFRRPAPLLGGLAIGTLVAASWWLTGAVGFLPEHPQTLEPTWLATDSRRPEGLSFVAPTAYALELLTLWSDRSTTMSFGIATALGTLLGGFGAALAARAAMGGFSRRARHGPAPVRRAVDGRRRRDRDRLLDRPGRQRLVGAVGGLADRGGGHRRRRAGGAALPGLAGRTRRLTRVAARGDGPARRAQAASASRHQALCQSRSCATSTRAGRAPASRGDGAAGCSRSSHTASAPS